jgi:hypothetical protein
VTAHRPVWLYCDAGEDVGKDCEPSGDGSLQGQNSVRTARGEAKRDGWRVTRGPDGKVRDVCPESWEGGRR